VSNSRQAVVQAFHFFVDRLGKDPAVFLRQAEEFRLVGKLSARALDRDQVAKEGFMLSPG
jgi:hypothetical protein